MSDQPQNPGSDQHAPQTKETHGVAKNDESDDVKENVVDAEFVAETVPVEKTARGLPDWVIRLIAATSTAILLAAVAAGCGMVWLLMATFASDGHSGELPSAVAYVFLAELGVGALMVIVPPTIILLGFRWQAALVATISVVAFAVAASFALFFVHVYLMSL